MKKEVKAVVFDIGGVLQLGSQRKKQGQLHASGVHESISKKLKISLDQYFDAIDTAYAKSIENKISKNRLLEIFSKNLKTPKSKIEKLYSNIYKKKFKFNKQLFKQILKLKKLNYKIAILSDQWHLSKQVLMPKKLYKIFNPIVISCDVGMRKPNLKIYNLLLKRIKLKPSEILFIDNQKWNIEPAKKLGINTLLYKNNKQLFENKKWRSLFE